MDPRFLKPLDRDLILEKVAKAPALLTVEEGVLHGGFGSAVLELLADEGLACLKVERMGIPDSFVEHGTRAELLEDLGLTTASIAQRARALVASVGGAKLRPVLAVVGCAFERVRSPGGRAF